MKKTFKLWSRKEDLELRKLWADGVKVKNISKKLNRSIPSVKSRVYLKKLENRFIRWRLSEEDILRENYGKKTLKEMSKMLNRSTSSLFKRAIRLGLSSHKRPWLKIEESTLKELHGKMDMREIAIKLDRSVSGILHRSRILGLSHKYKRWSKEDDNILTFNWGVYNVSTVAKMLDRSNYSIIYRAKVLKLGNIKSRYTNLSELEEITGYGSSTIHRIMKKINMKPPLLPSRKRDNVRKLQSKKRANYRQRHYAFDEQHIERIIEALKDEYLE
jgi:hypothetical protein